MTRAEAPVPAVTPARWAAAVSRVPLGSTAARLVVGQLADRASRSGRARVGTADLAACCCLSVVKVSDVLADLASRGLLGRDGDVLVLLLPERGPR